MMERGGYALQVWRPELGHYVWTGIIIEADSHCAACLIAGRVVGSAVVYRLVDALYSVGGVHVTAGYEAIFA